MVYVSFEQFLEEAAFIPGRRLRKRIRKELGDHMEDMLADKIEAGTDEKEAKKQVLSEMGDPAVLRKAFIRAHIAEIRATRLGILLSLAVLCFCAVFLVPPVYDELRTYHSSMSVEEAEQYLAEQTGEAFTFLGEVDYEGRIYRFYLPEKPSPYYRRLVYFSSIRFFGKNIPDRFSPFRSAGKATPAPSFLIFSCKNITPPIPPASRPGKNAGGKGPALQLRLYFHLCIQRRLFSAHVSHKRAAQHHRQRRADCGRKDSDKRHALHHSRGRAGRHVFVLHGIL